MPAPVNIYKNKLLMSQVLDESQEVNLYRKSAAKVLADHANDVAVTAQMIITALLEPLDPLTPATQPPINPFTLLSGKDTTVAEKWKSDLIAKIKEVIEASVQWRIYLLAAVD